MVKSSQVKSIQFMSFTKFTISCFHYWQKPGRVCQPSMTEDSAIRIGWKPLQRGTLYPQDSIHLPGEIHGSSYTKVCGVQIIEQTLSLVYSRTGSFPRARDTDFPVPAPLVLPLPGCRADGNLQEGKFPMTTGFGSNHIWNTSIKDETRPPILE
jgi:hypothetical protein